MLGLAQSMFVSQDQNLTNQLSKSDSSHSEITEKKIKSGASFAERRGTGESFEQRLEAALLALDVPLPGKDPGKTLPRPQLETQLLGPSSELITEAGSMPATEDALFALALAQGVSPEVAATVLWSSGRAAPFAPPPGALASPMASGLPQPASPASPPASGLPQLPPLAQVGANEAASIVGRDVPAAIASVASDVDAMSVPVLTTLQSRSRPESDLGGGGDPQAPGARLVPETGVQIPAGSSVPRVDREDRLALRQGVRDEGAVRITAARVIEQGIAPSMPAAHWIMKSFRVPFDSTVNDEAPLQSAARGLVDTQPATAASSAPLASLPTPADQAASSGAIAPPSAARLDTTLDLSVAEDAGSIEKTQVDRDAIQGRLSEALAQRMVNQIHRGQWSLHLELKPADLGNISIEMTMQNGRLEAMFDASSHAARLLIADGLERLRHDLERAGMNVAQLGMHNASNGSSGGKPTPGRSDRRGELGIDAESGGEDPLVPAAQAPGRESRGLDLMV